jgi:hypothetical protein
LITLAGSGGIGKTWLALSVLHAIATEGGYFAILWFSARDIDLLPGGPKPVTPRVVTDHDIAREFVELLGPAERRDKAFRPVDYFASALRTSPLGAPLMFVLDNFETVRNPVDVFSWINANVRHPNKVLITTRFRDFNGDYAVEVQGMTDAESTELIHATAAQLGVGHLLTPSYVSDVIRESGGHPYVMKILVGELARERRPGKVARIMAAKPQILDALFERTYSSLSPAARRLFLTLCSWRSAIPQVALEAVLLRPEVEERLDVEGGLEELRRFSLLEMLVSGEDRQPFLNVSLAARQFGLRKLNTSESKHAIEADLELLRTFGAAQSSDVPQGVGPRIDRMMRFIAERASQEPAELTRFLPIVEFVGQRYPRTFLLLARLYQEIGGRDPTQAAKAAIERFLNLCTTCPEQVEGWRALASLCVETDDLYGEARALVEIACLPDAAFRDISIAANKLNGVFYKQAVRLEGGEKQVIVRRIAAIMEERIEEGSADDCSRLAWLFLNLHESASALKYARMGLDRDSSNEHCHRLLERLTRGNSSLDFHGAEIG